MSRCARPYHHGDLPRSLIEHGMTEVEAHGAAALTVKHVAALAGVTHAAVYKHFENREGLLGAIANEGYEQLVTLVRTAMERADSPREEFLESGYTFVCFAQKRRQLYNLMFQGTFPVGIADLDAQDEDEGFGFLKRVVMRWQEEGLLGPGDVTSLGIFLWATVHGMAALVASGQLAVEGKALRQLAIAYFQRALDGLRVPNS